MAKLLLGFDIGSSSIKASVLDSESGNEIASASSPSKELPISAPRLGWAEQEPELWWEHVIEVTKMLNSLLLLGGNSLKEICAIGISYQMHGLVLVDKEGKVLRPAIIWCDSRSVQIGQDAFESIGPDRVLQRLLNSPGNFTASKMRWVLENEPEIAEKARFMMLPGDYIAWKMTDSIVTTPSGLSECVLWEFPVQDKAQFLLDYYKIDKDLIPNIVPTFSVQGTVTSTASKVLGVNSGIPITYRAGDQPNNALSLNVLDPGTVAATAGTSGVIYGVSDKAEYDIGSRVNTFVHVNYARDYLRYGVLLCLNGCGILNSWLRNNTAMGIHGLNEKKTINYSDMNKIAGEAPIGAKGLIILPFGNGSERMLSNIELGASFHGLNFNIHQQSHLFRAAQEGIAFGMAYGLKLMNSVGINPSVIRCGYANLFQSDIFTDTFATVTGVPIELFNTDGAQGAARGAGIGAGVFSMKSAFLGLEKKVIVEPSTKDRNSIEDAYGLWTNILTSLLNNFSFF